MEDLQVYIYVHCSNDEVIAAGPSALLSVVNPIVGGCGRAVNELVV